MRLIRSFLRLCALAGVLALAGSYLGALHPVGDSLAVFRLWIAGAVLVAGLALLLLRDRAWALYFTLMAAIAGSSPAMALLGPTEAVTETGAGYSLYQRNLLFRARDTEGVLSEIEAIRPDFLTLQEVSQANRTAIYETLPPDYDRAICRFASVGDVAVASRHRFVPGSTLCVGRLGLVAVQVETPDGIVWLSSIHLHWPWPFGQRAQVEQILPLISRMDGPVLIGGDFNMVRWSHTLSEFERVSGSRLIEQGRPTFRFTWRGLTGPGLEIDHILLPTDHPVGGQRLGFQGSDHRAVLAHFDLPGAG